MKSRYRNLLIIFIILIYSTLFLSCNKDKLDIVSKNQIIWKIDKNKSYRIRVDGVVGNHVIMTFDKDWIYLSYSVYEDDSFEEGIKDNIMEYKYRPVASGYYAAFMPLGLEFATDNIYKLNIPGEEGILNAVTLVRNLTDNKVYLIGFRFAPYEVTEFNELHPDKEHTIITGSKGIYKYMINDKLYFPIDGKFQQLDKENEKVIEEIEMKNITGIMVKDDKITLKYEDDTKEVFTIKRIETTRKYINDIDKSTYEYVFVKVK